MNKWLTDWLTDWKTDRLTGWLTDWLNDWLPDWLMTDRLTHWLTIWLTNCLNEWINDWLTDWLTDRLADWLTDWLTDRLTDWLTDWLADWLVANLITDWRLSMQEKNWLINPYIDSNWLAECCIYCLGVDRLIYRLKNLELTVWLWSWVKRFKKSNMATMKNHNFNIWIKDGLCFSLTTCRWSSEIISWPILSPNNLRQNFCPKTWV